MNSTHVVGDAIDRSANDRQGDSSQFGSTSHELIDHTRCLGSCEPLTIASQPVTVVARPRSFKALAIEPPIRPTPTITT